MTNSTCKSLNSISLQSNLETLNTALQIAEFDEEKHLKEREKQYCDMHLLTQGIFVIRETDDGWWKESIDFKGDVSKQIDKLKNDPTVACGWTNTARFNEPGGWSDPNG